VVNKIEGGDDHFYSEVYPEPGKGWMPVFKFGQKNYRLLTYRGMKHSIQLRHDLKSY
jgi:hypothetical protein